MHIKDLIPDKRNARKHNPRNIGMIEKSLQEVGAARSIVIDEDNNILAGNGTIEAAAQAGMTNVQVVEADGNTIIAVKRTGLTKEQKLRLAVLDNRTAETAEWDADVLKELSEEIKLDDIFRENELAIIFGDPVNDIEKEWDGMPEHISKEILGDAITCIVRFPTEADRDKFSNLLGTKLTLRGKAYSMWFPVQNHDQFGKGLQFTDES